MIYRRREPDAFAAHRAGGILPHGCRLDPCSPQTVPGFIFTGVKMSFALVSKLETLESRRLLSSAILGSAGVLNVIGGDSVNDNITVGITDAGTHVRVVIAGTSDQFFDATMVKKIHIRGLGGDDTIYVSEWEPMTLPVEIDGGAGNDTLTGSAAADKIRGGAGNDQINGLDGKNDLAGGAGNDVIWGGAGSDKIDGGAGKDVIVGFAGNDILRGGAGNDTLSGFDGNDLIIGGSGNDVAMGGGDNDTLIGGAGDDSLMGETGDDMLLGAAGKDTLLGAEGNDTLWGGNHGKKKADVIDGGIGENVILGVKPHGKMALKLGKLIKSFDMD
jgi:Ca2+-binding RTX toxin-like protein